MASIPIFLRLAMGTRRKKWTKLKIMESAIQIFVIVVVLFLIISFINVVRINLQLECNNKKETMHDVTV